MNVETALAPDRVRAALLDFSEGRPKIWPGIEPSLYEVYTVGETSAEIREGTKLPGMKVWARERYDWSDEKKVRWTVMESNFSTVGSYVEAAVSPREGGGSHVHIVWNREGSTLLGKLVVRAIALTKGKPVADSMQKAFDKLAKGAA
jgi:hypothetical protein